MTKGVSHPKSNGIVANKEGTGAYEMTFKVDNVHYIIVLSDSGKAQVDQLHAKYLPKDKEGMLEALSSTTNVLNDLAIDDVYVNHLGTKASQQELQAAFGTTNIREVTKQILTHGKFH